MVATEFATMIDTKSSRALVDGILSKDLAAPAHAGLAEALCSR
jgi:hypothetical protein